VDNYLCDALSLEKRFVIPAPDQSRGQAPAGIQDGEGVSTTESLDSRVRGKDGWGIDISGSFKFKVKHCRYHAASNIVRVSARSLSAICIDSPIPALFSNENLSFFTMWACSRLGQTPSSTGGNG
jgi:hypothetical protein